MLKKRVIPIVLLDGFSVIKTIKFDVRRNLGSPITVMRTYNTRNIDEMIIIDIDATKNNRPIDKFIISEITSECFMPITVGGGIKSCKDIEQLLKAGADKVSINSFGFSNPEFISESSKIFGAQCIVASVDIIKVDNEYYLYINNKIVKDLKYLEWILRLEDLGAGEILLNDVTRDGSMLGSDKILAKSIANKISIPLIFAGGISGPEDVAELIEISDVDAVGVSSIFHFTNFTPADCRESIRQRGLPAR